MDFFSLLFGGGEPSPEFKEIVKLHEMLEKENIPHTFVPYMGGYSLRYFGKKEFTDNDSVGISNVPVICSVIEHRGSYGHENDLLEIQGLRKQEDSDEHSGVIGNLTAEDVFKRIKDHYNIS